MIMEEWYLQTQEETRISQVDSWSFLSCLCCLEFLYLSFSQFCFCKEVLEFSWFHPFCDKLTHKVCPWVFLKEVEQFWHWTNRTQKFTDSSFPIGKFNKIKCCTFYKKGQPWDSLMQVLNSGIDVMWPGDWPTGRVRMWKCLENYHLT